MREAVCRLSVTNYRSARRLDLEFGTVGALIGEPGAGKSNVLSAIGFLLDPEWGAALLPADARVPDVSIDATLADGRAISLSDCHGAPPVVALPARLRANELFYARAGDERTRAVRDAFERAMRGSPIRPTAFLRALESCAGSIRDVVFLIEEPELYLAPQGQRYLYRLLHRLAAHGNQVLFTTHSPNLLNVASLEEIYLVSRDAEGVTTVERLEAVDADDEFRAMCEFDAARSELFFSRAALLVEGMTEKVAFPRFFEMMGYDADGEGISIVDCGGKTNIPLFIEICRRAHIPYIAVFDSDIKPDRQPSHDLLRLNQRMRQAAGRGRYVILDPDFEGVLGIHRGVHKPDRARRSLEPVTSDHLPKPITRAVRLAVGRARPNLPTYARPRAPADGDGMRLGPEGG